MLEVVIDMRCVLGIMLCMLFLHVVLYVALYAVLYSGGRGRRAPFLMRFVLELRALRVVGAGSWAPCAGGREVRAACDVDAVICCMLLVNGRCMMYAGGYAPCRVYCSVCWRPWRVNSICWRSYAVCCSVFWRL